MASGAATPAAAVPTLAAMAAAPATPHLVPVPRQKDLYRYRDLPEGEVIEVEVTYMTGSSPASRGIYIRIRPATVTADTHGFMLLAGASVRVRSLARSTPRILQAAVRHLEPRVVKLAEAYREDEAAGRAAFEAYGRELAAVLAPL
ncbi:MAG: hypothetical protein AB1941_00650 [Gemmatimonadota bacterium]